MRRIRFATMRLYSVQCVEQRKQSSAKRNSSVDMQISLIVWCNFTISCEALRTITHDNESFAKICDWWTQRNARMRKFVFATSVWHFLAGTTHLDECRRRLTHSCQHHQRSTTHWNADKRRQTNWNECSRTHVRNLTQVCVEGLSHRCDDPLRHR